jgi:hypothetical protein
MPIISAFVVTLFGTFACFAACRGLEKREVRYAVLSYELHVVSAFVQWQLAEFYYEGNADIYSYMDDGSLIVRALEQDFIRFAPEVLKYACHLEFHLPAQPFWTGVSGTMSAMTGMIMYLVGPSLILCNLVSGWIAWFGQMCLYRVAREEVGPDGIRPALVGVFLVPSVAFWGGGLNKESIVMGAFGLLALSTYHVLKSFKIQYMPTVVIGGLVVALIKPYVLFPCVVSASAWIYADRAWKTWGSFRVRPAYLVLAGALAIGGLAAMGTLYPEFAVEKLGDSMAQRQEEWQTVVGGSNVDLGSGEARSFAQQLPYVPLAVVDSLFRPFVFEARNGPQLMAALENTVFAIGVLGLLGKHTRSIVGEAFSRSPLLVFCLSFVACFAIAVGLATSNLGSLSRYRVPMMPFYATALLLLRQHARAQQLSVAEVRRLASSPVWRSRQP